VAAAAGCGKDPQPVAQVPPATTPADTPTTQPPPPVGPPATAGTTPTRPGDGAVLPGGFVFKPPGTPATPPTGGGTFVPPSSPTFTPPETLGGGNPPPPGTPPAPPTGPGPMPPKPADPPAKPADPPPTNTEPETPKPMTPEKVTYPDKVAGRDLKGWLKELEYTGGGPVQKDDQVRETAVKMIPSFGPDARKPAVRPLINAIQADPDPGVQIAAITVVSSMGFDMRDEVRPVIAVLQNKLGLAGSGNMVKMYCVRSLASFGPDATTAIKYLKDSCLDPSWETRKEVAIALSLIGAAPADDKGNPKKGKDGHPIGPNVDAINILLDYQLLDRSVNVRLEAAKSLLALGPLSIKDPLEYIEKTKKPLEAIDKAVRFEGGKGPKTNARGATPDRGMYVWVLLLQVMYDDRQANANLLELARLVKEPDGPKADEVRLFALQALGVGGGLLQNPTLEKGTVEKVVKAVADALAYEHEPVLQYTALQTLAMIGKTADPALPAVEKVAASKPKPPPEGAPKGTPPDDSMQRMAKQTAEVLTGRRKIEDFGKEDPKPGEKKDEVKAAPPK
jgi:HEAT repeat protein